MLERVDTMRLGNSRGLGFGEKPHDYDHRSKNTLSQLPLGHADSKNEIHHIFGIQEHLRPFVENLSDNEADAIIRLLNSKGVRVSNDPRNLISLDEMTHDQVHEALQNVGLDTAGRKEDLEFLEKVSKLPFKERMIAAEVYGDHIYPGIIEQMQAQGLNVPTVAENIAYNNQLIKNEANYGRKEHMRDIIEDAPVLNKKGTELKSRDAQVKRYIDRVLDDQYQFGEGKQRFAQKAVPLMNAIENIKSDIDTKDQGKAINVFANTVLMGKGINGNGNGRRRR